MTARVATCRVSQLVLVSILRSPVLVESGGTLRGPLDNPYTLYWCSSPHPDQPSDKSQMPRVLLEQYRSTTERHILLRLAR